MSSDELSKNFLNVFEENIGIVLKVSRAYTKNFQDREDLINDIVFELWKSFKTFKGNSKISTWIYRVALNTSMNYKRKKEKDSIFFFVNSLNEAEHLAWLMEKDNTPELEILYECIDNLDEINKAIILLYLDGNSHDEISEITGISKTNVGTKIGRIKEELKSLSNSKK